MSIICNGNKYKLGVSSNLMFLSRNPDNNKDMLNMNVKFYLHFNDRYIYMSFL